MKARKLRILGRGMAARRAERPGIAVVVGLEQPVRQDLLDAAVLERGGRHEARHAADAEIGQHRLQPHAGMIGDIPAAHVDRHRASPSLEAPARVDRVLAERDAAVRGQLARMRGPAVPRQVGRRRAHHVLDAHQLPADQARRRIVSDPKHDVDLVVDRIELAVVELQHHVDGGMRRQEIGNVGVDQEAAQRARRADPDRAGRLGRAAFGQRHHRLRGGHQLASMAQRLQALVAESQPARAAQDQPRGRARAPAARSSGSPPRGVEPSRRAASEKLPASATLTKVAISSISGGI